MTKPNKETDRVRYKHLDITQYYIALTGDGATL